MKSNWLILIIFAVVGSSAFLGAFKKKSFSSSIFNRKKAEESVEREIDKVFANFTELFQDGHPSTAIPLKAITTCLKQKGFVEPIKNFFVQIQMFQITNSSDEEKEAFCYKSVPKFHEIVQCKSSVDPIKYEKFLIAIYEYTKFNFQLACATPDDTKKMTLKKVEALKLLEDLPKYANYIKEDENLHLNGITPSEAHSCSPVRVAEAYKIAAIKSHRIPIFVRGAFAVTVQISTTLRGKYPFMSVEDCAKN